MRKGAGFSLVVVVLAAGLPVAGAAPADFDAYVLSELKRWEKVIRDNNVRID